MEAVLEEQRPWPSQVPVSGAATDQVRKSAQKLGTKTGWDGLVGERGPQPGLFF